MIFKTRGIIFKTIKYSETSLIMHIYTEEKGLKKYIISGVRNKGSKNKTGLLRPLSLVDMVAYFRENKELNRIKEIKAAYIYQSLPFDLLKGTIGLFMVELAQKTILEEEANAPLFQFLFDTFQNLDQTEFPPPNYHLEFMLDLSAFLGFRMGGIWSEETPFIDMKDGIFVEHEPHHQYYLDPHLSEKVSRLLQGADPGINREERKQITAKLIDYYKLHIDNFQGLNTHSILREVLEN